MEGEVMLIESRMREAEDVMDRREFSVFSSEVMLIRTDFRVCTPSDADSRHSPLPTIITVDSE